MSKGYDQILAELFPLAAGYSVSVDKEMTVVTGSVHRDKAAEFYALFSDALLAPGFRPEDFERLKDQSVNALEKSLRFSSDEELGKAALTARVFRGTRYAHPDLGTVQGLSMAIGKFGQTLQGAGDLSSIRLSLQGVTGGLATAFETTLVALVFALVLQLWITLQQKREMAFLDECNDYCHLHVVSKLRLSDRT